MAVKLRLKRTGRRNLPFAQIVASDSRVARNGESLAILGTYDTTNSSMVTLDEQGLAYWIKNGAQMTDSVKKIVKAHQKASIQA